MTTISETRLLRVLLMLSGITLVSWFLGSEHDSLDAQFSAAITYGALLIAAVKVRVIVFEFMEAHRVSKKLQFAMDTWLVLLVASLTLIYALHLGVSTV